MPTKWYNAQVMEVNQLTPSTRQFFVKVTDDEEFNFLPGQFVTFDLPVSEKRLHRWRSYSIANQPASDNILEFCIVRSKVGLGTKYLFENINVGSILQLKGPEGRFTLPQNLEKEIVMICTGTGVAPFRSMVRHLIYQNIKFNKVHLIFGTRNVESLLYHHEFEEYASVNPNFIYDVALSREQISGFHHGYVHSIYKSYYQDVSSDRLFYLCGWSSMVDQAVKNLISEIGYDTSQVLFELYG